VRLRALRVRSLVCPEYRDSRRLNVCPANALGIDKRDVSLDDVRRCSARRRSPPESAPPQYEPAPLRLSQTRPPTRSAADARLRFSDDPEPTAMP